MRIIRHKFIVCSLYAVPILLLAGLVIHRQFYPREPGNWKPATETNQNYKEQQDRWLANHFEKLYENDNIPDKLQKLPIQIDDSIRSDIDQAELYDAITKIVKSILATSFDEYLAMRMVGESFLMNQKAIASQAGMLQRFYKMTDLPKSPLEIHRMFWSNKTKDGQRASLWSEVSWKASWIQCSSTTTHYDIISTKSFSDTLINNVPNCGIVGYRSSFEYSPKPKEVFVRNDQIIKALAYLLVKTNEGVAYPLIIQFYWAPSIDIWFPANFAVGYVGKRQFDPIF